MAENRENASNDQETNSEEQKVDIKPSESKTSGTSDPGHTPGKAEGEDDESATG